MDIFDIGQDLGYVGQVKAVKILGALAVNDVSRLY
jgi:inorganic pyrophosphatase